MSATLIDNDDGTCYDDDNADDIDDDEGHVFENDEDSNKKNDNEYVLWVKEQGISFVPVHINLAKVDIRT